MKNLSGTGIKIFIVLFVGSLLVMLYGYIQGYDLSVPWNATSTAEAEEIIVHRFQKGPFEFEFKGEKYSLTETFFAGPIERHYRSDTFFLSLIFFGICVILSVSSCLSRVWFIGVSCLFILFIINLRLQDIGLFGFPERSSLPVIIILTGYLIPVYLFHAFFTEVKFIYRLLILLMVTSLITLFCQINLIALQEQVIVGSYYGLVTLALLFLLLIAEENIFAILYFITRSRGGKNNHIHFVTFSLVYLVFLAAYYGKKSGLMNFDLTYFDPYILFAVSALSALWTLKFKNAVFENIISIGNVQLLFSAIGIVTFGFLALSFFRGNDPVYEGLHYFIIYAHLGFGAMFFFYLLLNFINPLSKGSQVYKIAYKAQNFPYLSAKLAGIAAVAGFFFLANKEAFFLVRSGHYNYLGAQAETANEIPLAQEYYREGSIYGFDNHFSNYKIAYHQLLLRDVDEANYRFGRATLRYPSAQSFVNQSGTFAMRGETTPSLISLKNGLHEFPKNARLLNNLGLIYLDLNDTTNALNYLKDSDLSDEWTNVSLVNCWKINPIDTIPARNDYNKGNLSVKANILDRFLESGIRPEFTFDTTCLYPSYPLHRMVYLINSCWYFQCSQTSDQLEKSLSGAMNEQIYQSARQTIGLSAYLQGNINQALFAYEILRNEASVQDQGKYLNELGLIALEQHALANALDFFNQAVEKENRKAMLNKTAILLEMGEPGNAIRWAESLIEVDSNYQILVKDLKGLSKTGNDLTHLYYFHQEYSIPEIVVRLEEANLPFIRSLWKKIESELLIKREYDRLSDYQSLFKNYLDPASFEESQVLISLHNGELIQNAHPLSMALLLDSAEAKTNALKDIANQNALNVPVLLAATKELNDLNEDLAYDALLEAYNLNKFSPELIKAYVDQCLQMNLIDYSAPALHRLADLVSDTEYFEYVGTVNKRLEKIKKENVW